jgi:hypothetical protein
VVPGVRLWRLDPTSIFGLEGRHNVYRLHEPPVCGADSIFFRLGMPTESESLYLPS